MGTVNVTATNIAVHDGLNAGFIFSYGCVIIETICLCIVLAAMDWVSKRQKIFRLFEWLTTILILVMAAASFIAAYEMRSFGDNIFTSYHLSPFLLGIVLSSLNPLHIPFWIGWTTILINKGVLTPGKKNYLIYVAAITIGTFVGFALFIFGGNHIITKVGKNQQLINWVIGCVLLITAIVQLYKMLLKNSPIKINTV